MWSQIRWCLPALLSVAVACGTRPHTTPPPDTGDPELQEAYRAAVKALDAGRDGDARGRLEALAPRAKGTPLEPFVRYQRGRLTARRDPLRGSRRLLALAAELGDASLADDARLAGGLAAVEAKQCIDAGKALAGFVDGPDARPAAQRALSRCRQGLEALALLDAAATADDSAAAADRTAAAKAARALDLQAMATAVRQFGDGPLSEPLRVRLAELAGSADDRELMLLAVEGLPADHPAAREVQTATRSARLGLILPLSGRSRPLGRGLRAVATGLYGTDEDRPDGAPTLVIRDGGRPAAIAEAMEGLRDAGVFAAIGVFDSTTAATAARAAAEAGIPLVMLTLSDAPLKVDGAVWRAMPTPTLVVRTAAGAGLAAGGKVAAVARASDGYGETHARLFAAAWQAGGGQVVGEIAWNPKKADYAAVARQLAGAQFDTLFVPADPTGAAQLMRHLAAAGVWARGSGAPRFSGEKGIREVQVLGTPTWYRPDLPRLGGRYVHGVRIPVAFARETARGGPFADRVQAAAGRSATAFDALMVDGIEAMRRAWTAHLERGCAVDDCLRSAKGKGATAGLDFGQRDALPALYLLEVTPEGFRPAK